MIKKTVLALSLITTLANADIQEKGFFVGLDYSSLSADIAYENSDGDTPSAFPYKGYDTTNSDSALSLKAGYQYYFTRVYARVSSFEYTDETKDRFTFEGNTIELNAEYIPVFYMSQNKSWDIRGIFGVGMGYNDAKMTEGEVGLAPADAAFYEAQKNIEYGYQVGVMVETDIGLSAELGYRYRVGNFIEFTDGQNDATWHLKTTEIYLGLNYLF